jgi:hypothetical protein
LRSPDRQSSFVGFGFCLPGREEKNGDESGEREALRGATHDINATNQACHFVAFVAQLAQHGCRVGIGRRELAGSQT